MKLHYRKHQKNNWSPEKYSNKNILQNVPVNKNFSDF